MKVKKSMLTISLIALMVTGCDIRTNSMIINGAYEEALKNNDSEQAFNNFNTTWVKIYEGCRGSFFSCDWDLIESARSKDMLLLRKAVSAGSISASVKMISPGHTFNANLGDFSSTEQKSIIQDVFATAKITNDPDLLLAIGLLYKNGEYVARNYEIALSNLNAAWLQGNQSAASGIAEIYEVLQDTYNAYIWALRAHEIYKTKELEGKMSNLSVMYIQSLSEMEHLLKVPAKRDGSTKPNEPVSGEILSHIGEHP